MEADLALHTLYSCFAQDHGSPCDRCRAGAGGCRRATREAIAKLYARERLRAVRGEPWTVFDETCKARGLGPEAVSLGDVLKWLWPQHDYVGLYERRCLFDELHRYDERCQRLRGTTPRRRDELAALLGLEEDGGLWALLYRDSPLFGLIKKDGFVDREDLARAYPPPAEPLPGCATCGEDLGTFLRDECDACLEARWARERAQGAPA
jgi:hypothetical protein